MIVLSGKDISKSYGTDIITEDVSFGVEKGDRIGIVGPNGCGKTTLLSIISGDIEPTSGSVYIRSDTTVGYLRQRNHFFGGGTVLGEAQKSFQHFYRMEREIEELQEKISDHTRKDFERCLEDYTALIEEYEKQGGYTYKSELAAVLKAMGFTEEDQLKKIDILSGGERTRLALACMLLRKPDILILDEVFGIVDNGIITEEELLGVLSQRGLTDVILTGAQTKNGICRFADEVSEINTAHYEAGGTS